MNKKKVNNRENQIKELLASHFETEIRSDVGLTSYLIFPDGSIFGAYSHRDMMDYLADAGALEKEEVNKYDTDIFNELFDCVRCSDYDNDENYIELTKKPLTDAQYKQLEAFIDNNINIGRPGIQVCPSHHYEDNSCVIYNYSSITDTGAFPTEYIIKKIRNYYTRGKLTEDFCKAMYSRLNEAKKDNTFSFRGKDAWCGSVDTTDGAIEEIHTYDEAKRNGFHHSFLFSEPQLDKMDSGNSCFFFVDTDGKIYVDPVQRFSSGEVLFDGDFLKERIGEQITKLITEDISVGKDLDDILIFDTKYLNWDFNCRKGQKSIKLIQDHYNDCNWCFTYIPANMPNHITSNDKFTFADAYSLFLEIGVVPENLNDIDMFDSSYWVGFAYKGEISDLELGNLRNDTLVYKAQQTVKKPENEINVLNYKVKLDEDIQVGNDLDLSKSGDWIQYLYWRGADAGDVVDFINTIENVADGPCWEILINDIEPSSIPKRLEELCGVGSLNRIFTFNEAIEIFNNIKMEPVSSWAGQSRNVVYNVAIWFTARALSDRSVTEIYNAEEDILGRGRDYLGSTALLYKDARVDYNPDEDDNIEEDISVGNDIKETPVLKPDWNNPNVYFDSTEANCEFKVNNLTLFKQICEKYNLDSDFYGTKRDIYVSYIHYYETQYENIIFSDYVMTIWDVNSERFADFENLKDLLGINDDVINKFRKKYIKKWGPITEDITVGADIEPAIKPGEWTQHLTNGWRQFGISQEDILDIINTLDSLCDKPCWEVIANKSYTITLDPSGNFHRTYVGSDMVGPEKDKFYFNDAVEVFNKTIENPDFFDVELDFNPTVEDYNNLVDTINDEVQKKAIINEYTFYELHGMNSLINIPVLVWERPWEPGDGSDLDFNDDELEYISNDLHEKIDNIKHYSTGWITPDGDIIGTDNKPHFYSKHNCEDQSKDFRYNFGYERYIGLPLSSRPTNAQLNKIRDLLDYYFINKNNVGERNMDIEIDYPTKDGDYSFVNVSPKDYTSDEVIALIKRISISRHNIQEKIVKKGNKWQVQSEKGRNLGTYDTKPEAEKRLKQVHYFKHMNEDLQETDNEGNILSPEQVEFFKDSKVRNDKGQLIVCYHGTDKKFDVFEKGDIGFHFGTKGQAEFVAKEKRDHHRNVWGDNKTDDEIPELKDVNVGAYYLNIKNPANMYDFGPTGPYSITYWWWYQSFGENYGESIFEFDLTQEELDQINKVFLEEGGRTFGTGNTETDIADDCEAEECDRYVTDIRYGSKEAQLLRNLLKKRGYDGIVYTNNFEDVDNDSNMGDLSYIAFESNQIKSITNKNPTNSNNINEDITAFNDNNSNTIIIKDSNIKRKIKNWIINYFYTNLSDYQKALMSTYKNLAKLVENSLNNDWKLNLYADEANTGEFVHHLYLNDNEYLTLWKDEVNNVLDILGYDPLPLYEDINVGKDITFDKVDTNKIPSDWFNGQSDDYINQANEIIKEYKDQPVWHIEAYNSYRKSDERIFDGEEEEFPDDFSFANGLFTFDEAFAIYKSLVDICEYKEFLCLCINFTTLINYYVEHKIPKAWQYATSTFLFTRGHGETEIKKIIEEDISVGKDLEDNLSVLDELPDEVFNLWLNNDKEFILDLLKKESYDNVWWVSYNVVGDDVYTSVHDPKTGKDYTDLFTALQIFVNPPHTPEEMETPAYLYNKSGRAVLRLDFEEDPELVKKVREIILGKDKVSEDISVGQDLNNNASSVISFKSVEEYRPTETTFGGVIIKIKWDILDNKQFLDIVEMCDLRLKRKQPVYDAISKCIDKKLCLQKHTDTPDVYSYSVNDGPYTVVVIYSSWYDEDKEKFDIDSFETMLDIDIDESKDMLDDIDEDISAGQDLNPEDYSILRSLEHLVHLDNYSIVPEFKMELVIDYLASKKGDTINMVRHLILDPETNYCIFIRKPENFTANVYDKYAVQIRQIEKEKVRDNTVPTTFFAGYRLTPIELRELYDLVFGEHISEDIEAKTMDTHYYNRDYLIDAAIATIEGDDFIRREDLITMFGDKPIWRFIFDYRKKPSDYVRDYTSTSMTFDEAYKQVMSKDLPYNEYRCSTITIFVDMYEDGEARAFIHKYAHGTRYFPVLQIVSQEELPVNEDITVGKDIDTSKDFQYKYLNARNENRRERDVNLILKYGEESRWFITYEDARCYEIGNGLLHTFPEHLSDYNGVKTFAEAYKLFMDYPLAQDNGSRFFSAKDSLNLVFMADGLELDDWDGFDGHRRIVLFRTADKDDLPDVDEDISNSVKESREDFFKKSVVRDEEGNLLPVYHCSFSDFDTFAIDQEDGTIEDKSWSGYAGFAWFAKDVDYAKNYGDGSFEYECYLNITNPLDIGEVNYEVETDDSGNKIKDDFTESGYIFVTDEFIRLCDIVKSDPEVMIKYYHKWWETGCLYDLTRRAFFKNIVKKLGYDGVIATEGGNKTWGCMSANQIKLISNENPTDSMNMKEDVIDVDEDINVGKDLEEPELLEVVQTSYDPSKSSAGWVDCKIKDWDNFVDICNSFGINIPVVYNSNNSNLWYAFSKRADAGTIQSIKLLCSERCNLVLSSNFSAEAFKEEYIEDLKVALGLDTILDNLNISLTEDITAKDFENFPVDPRYFNVEEKPEETQEFIDEYRNEKVWYLFYEHPLYRPLDGSKNMFGAQVYNGLKTFDEAYPLFTNEELQFKSSWAGPSMQLCVAGSAAEEFKEKLDTVTNCVLYRNGIADRNIENDIYEDISEDIQVGNDIHEEPILKFKKVKHRPDADLYEFEILNKEAIMDVFSNFEDFDGCRQHTGYNASAPWTLWYRVYWTKKRDLLIRTEENYPTVVLTFVGSSHPEDQQRFNELVNRLDIPGLLKKEHLIEDISVGSDIDCPYTDYLLDVNVVVGGHSMSAKDLIDSFSDQPVWFRAFYYLTGQGPGAKDIYDERELTFDDAYDTSKPLENGARVGDYYVGLDLRKTNLNYTTEDNNPFVIVLRIPLEDSSENKEVNEDITATDDTEDRPI